MSLIPKSFTTLVQDAATSIQGSVSSVMDFSVGTVLRALVESVSSVVLWLQGLILQLLTTTRASTSSGSDLDSWMLDFGVYRLPAVAAQGSVTFSRFTPTQQALIPVGTVVQTADGTEKYTVIADTNQAAYSPTQNAYVIVAGQSSVTATVQAVNLGTEGNVVANAISQIAQSLPGVDNVVNAQGFTSGQDPESDAALRVRFIGYLASLSEGTKSAIGAAINDLQLGLTFTITEDVDVNNTSMPGYFYVTVTNASGTPGSNVISSVYNAIDAVRAAGVRFDVYGPTIVPVNVSLSLQIASGYAFADVSAAVTAAITAYLNSLPLGATLPFTRLATLAYVASPGVANVTGVTANGGTVDLIAGATQVIKAGSISVGQA